MRTKDNKIKLMFLSIQKDNFDQFQQCLEECTKDDNVNNLRNSSEDSALHVAAQNGRLSILRYLVEEKDASIELKNNNRKTPLHEAAQFSQYKIVEYLIEKGADVNAIKNADWTPLMLACTKIRDDVVSILLRHGADPLFRNKDGWNSFHIASREGCVEILKLLVSQLANPTVERMNQLINSSSKNGRKPLHTAALNGQIDAVNYLLRSNFTTKVDDVDNCGTTPLMDSVRSGSTETFDLLVQFGADVTLLNKVGYNCLHIAAEVGLSNVILHLVRKYNFDVNGLTDQGSMTAIQIAVKEKQFDAVKTLEILSSKEGVPAAN
ncbi:Ankyrin repeat domain-containing protein 16 [Pseudolycoriella hygida]|uniref:Ankyrin repeat domain-containing protein 16 n=1 Tax=Pseudolycoriella hygida TaxID=35572 RepID=A0A9Q0RY61_9DIPT|nr:Ankyrin repeat domain-containing protein 16 [Pseudolycoriella hygida]